MVKYTSLQCETVKGGISEQTSTKQSGSTRYGTHTCRSKTGSVLELLRLLRNYILLKTYTITCRLSKAITKIYKYVCVLIMVTLLLTQSVSKSIS